MTVTLQDLPALRRRAERLATLVEVSSAFVATLDRDAILQAATDGVARLAGFDNAAVYLLDGPTLRLGAATPPLPPGFPEHLRLAPLADHPHIGSALASGAPLAVNDVRTEALTEAERVVVEWRGLRTVLYAPMIAGVKALGVLIVASSDAPRALTAEEVDLCRALANLAALATENARLLQAGREYAATLERQAVEARRAERERLELERQLLRAQQLESLGVLAGGIAHDFNNLLTGITGNISVAREAIGPGSQAAEALADAESASVRARSLTHQLLTFARGGAPTKRQHDLSSLVEEAARFAVHGAGTALTLDMLPGLMVEADGGQVGQVVQNLVLNGIQAMGSSGTLKVETSRASVPPGDPRGWRPGTYAVLSVVDAGPGVPPDLLPRIFEPFFTTKATGKGLGLAICHSIVAKHDGYLEVLSPQGGGSVFRVWLPATSAADRRPATTDPAPAAAPRPSGTPRILVMDDEEVVRRLAVRLLQPLGYEVVEALDGAEVVERYVAARAAGRPFDAVIMDLTIPGGMGGLEALGQLRQLDPDVVALVSSGYSNDPIMATWAEQGFRGALAKPYLAVELREALHRALAR